MGFSKLTGICGGVIVVAAIFAAPASADFLTVTNTNDSGPGSLRQAVMDANAVTSSSDTITITATGTVNLQSELPAIADGTSVNILGPGSGAFTVQRDSGGDYRILTVGTATSVTIVGLTLAEGRVEPALPVTAEGAGILNSGDLSLNDVVIRDNVVTKTGVLEARAHGAGIFNSGELLLSNSSVRGNGAESLATDTSFGDAFSLGGGIYNAASGTLTIRQSTVSGNHARAETLGAAVGPDATAQGGGVYSEGDLIVQNSTISGNAADGFKGGGEHLGAGAGITSVGPEALLLESSTVAANASVGAANLFVLDSPAPLTITNTVFAEPAGGGLNCGYQFAPAFSFEAFNLSDDMSCELAAPSDQEGEDALLGPLSANGGPTLTHLPQKASPLVDQGNSGFSTDQRGVARPVEFPGIPNAPGGNGSDIGAVELRRPSVALVPEELDMGSQQLGTLSGAQEIAITNTGEAAIAVGHVSVAGAHRDDFLISSDECSDTDVAPGAACEVRVRFGPSAEGERSAEMRVPSDAVNGLVSAALSGEGTVPADPAPETTITQSPKPKTHNKQARISFSSSKPGSTFECSLDDAQFKACTSPATFRVKRGRHTLEVRARDSAGKVDPTPAKVSWKVVKKKR